MRRLPRKGRRCLLVLAALLSTQQVAAGTPPAGVADPARARINYMLNCQGCHGARAEGSDAAGVPKMEGVVGDFLRVPGGREFLVQVPGSANASVDDAQLAELLNWMLHEVSGESLPTDFAPYTAAEVTALRYTPEDDVAGTRERLVREIEQANKQLR